MGSALRKTRSFSLDAELISEVERTKGRGSASERVNSLLKYALEMEQKAVLRDEAANFFADHEDDPKARRPFQDASIKSWSRE